MKLRLPSLLLSAIVALQFANTASADYIGSGVYYDTGKEHFSSSPDAVPYSDSVMCWAVAGSNAMQYWQDTYYSEYAEIGTPNGFSSQETQDKYLYPYGTRYLEIYEQVRTSMTDNSGGYSSNFFGWWTKGEEVSNLQKVSGNEDGFYTAAFSGREASISFTGGLDAWGSYAEYESGLEFKACDTEAYWNEFSQFIIDAFTVQGQAVALDINYGHAINCWGYETDSTGKRVTALILSDGDDQQFGTFRVELALEQTDVLNWGYDEESPYYITYGERLVLKTDDNTELQLHASLSDPSVIKSWVSAAYYINTPDGEASVAANSNIDPDELLSVNTRITSDKTIRGKGIVVNGGANTIVLTNGAKEDNTAAKLVLVGENAAASGLDTKDGNTTSLTDLSISGYAKDGLVSGGKTYLHNGITDISDNAGYGIKSSNYTELLNCSNVTISGNGGGGISNEKGTVSIRGNKSVTFQNTADNTNDIYNASGARFNISDNGSVLFKGEDNRGASENVAVVNKGVMNMSAGAGKEITFQNTTLKTEDEGKTYIGQDISARSTDTAGAVHFTSTDGGNMSICANGVNDVTYATLEKLSVNANTITGVGEGENVGTISNAVVTAVGPLTMSNVALDSSDVIRSASSAFITMDNVVVTLTNAEYDNGVFNLTGIFQGNMKLSGVTFDLTEVNLGGTAIENLTFNLSTAYTDKENMEVLVLTASSAGNPRALVGNQILLASEPLPEPTTGTLGLLALAGLCGRRRRR